MSRRYTLLLWLTGFVIAARVTAAEAPSIMPQEETARIVSVQHVTVKDHVISGEVVNKSAHPLRDVELLIEYHWMWNDERRPGDDPPGRAVYFAFAKDIPPGTSVPFVYTPESPLPARQDGHFSYEVSLAGFSIVEAGSEDGSD